jgi:hypothetical protein
VSGVLLVPMHLDAFLADGQSELVAPSSKYTDLPYHWADPFQSTPPPPRRHGVPPPPAQADMNPDNAFLSSLVVRPPAEFSGSSNKWTPPAGMHLHWALPDALTTQRRDSKSSGKSRFPMVPNRWLVRCSTQNAGQWRIASEWVIESDYLHPRPGRNAKAIADTIVFPIVPPKAYRDMLAGATIPPDEPTKEDYRQSPHYYSAPYRYMGRNQALGDWQSNGQLQDEYLTDYRSEGLTAIGNGDPMFAALYSNCHSVFGMKDYQTGSTYPRRYDVVGWYDAPDQDCLSLFHVLQEPDLYKALRSEYSWAVDNPASDLPQTSLYYARLTMNQSPASQLPSPSMNISIGNTATEALSAYIADDIAPALSATKAAEQKRIEEQLEAINLHSKLGHLTLDLTSKFQEARHEKGFAAKYGGAMWSVQVRSTAKKASDGEAASKSDITLPIRLSHALNELNIAQAAYDRANDEIETLRHRCFADWFRFEMHYNKSGGVLISADGGNNTTSYDDLIKDWKNNALPTTGFLAAPQDVVDYSNAGDLKRLKKLLAETGKLNIVHSKDGRYEVTVGQIVDNPRVVNLPTSAQLVVAHLETLAAFLESANSTEEMKRKKQVYQLIRKVAPRFWRPNDPVVLLEGATAQSTLRHGQDGRESEDGTLACSYLDVTLAEPNLTAELRKNGTAGTAFGSVFTEIEKLFSQKAGIAFQTQDKQPWNPIILEWEAVVYPEHDGTKNNSYNAGVDFDADYVDTNYEFDINATDFKLKKRPSVLDNSSEHGTNFSGRALLTPHSTKQIAYNISTYLLGLSLADLKQEAIPDSQLSDQTDYDLDTQLIAWAKKYLTLTDVPSLQDLASLRDDAEILAQQSAVSAWMTSQFPFREAKGKKLIDLVAVSQAHATWYTERPMVDEATGTIINFGNLPAIRKLDDPINTAIITFVKIGSYNVLSQSLGGFNDALLTRMQSLQLPVWDYRVLKNVDPNIPQTSEWRNFASDLNLSIADGARAQPLFDVDFMPIRSGLMQIRKLYLIDTFGQILEITPAKVTKSEPMTVSRNLAQTSAIAKKPVTVKEDEKYIYLAPRLAQEARINLRWLSADRGSAAGDGDEVETNDHPATTPVCGWFISNNLDGSLMVFDTDGKALGSIGKQITASQDKIIAWRPVPGVINRLHMTDIKNAHLRNLVTYLARLGSADNSWTFWNAFLAATNSAMENIAPESFAQHEALALLVGRPMAVVRASLSLEVQGLAAVNQGWWAYLHDMAGKRNYDRTTNQFDQVSFPVRVGEYSQLNDGLVGYWVESDDGYRGDLFRSSEIDRSNDPQHIVNHGTRQAITIPLAVHDAACKLMMLVDPRGSVHVTSGILPTKQISIPPDQYAAALRKMEVCFLTAPILTSLDDIELPLPAEEGYQWSWLTRPGAELWAETQGIKAATTHGQFSEQKLVEGWLKLSPKIPKKAG